MQPGTKKNFWIHFPTQKAAVEAIQAIIDNQPFKTPFESELISDLIAERHYFCSRHGIRPIRFRKIPGYRAYSFEGDFSHVDTTPKIDWHPVSWTKCLQRPRTNWERIVRAMRDRTEQMKKNYRDAHLVCEACGISPPVEAHHQEPTFWAITEAVRAVVSDEEVDQCLGDWNWLHKQDFTLPEDSEITKEFDHIHSTAILRALYKKCHDLTKRKTENQNGQQ